MKIKPYPTYKESDVPWLGEVPEHWEIQRMKYVFGRIIGGSTPSSSEPSYWDGDIVWVTPADISQHKHLYDSGRRLTLEGLSSCSAELVPPMSIIVTSRAPVGNVSLAEVTLCTNQGCKALTPNDAVIETKYALELMGNLKPELQSLANGTTFAEISTHRLGGCAIPLPPLPEQHAIAHFLNHIDTRINRAIRAKRKLIALLNEQKQAIIHHAVTRGLDPHAPLRPSGVEWLGDIPAHWEVRRSRYLFAEVVDTGHSEAQLLSIDRFKGIIPQTETGRRTRASQDRSAYKRVQPGQLAYNLMNAFMGAIGFSTYEGIVSPAYAVAKPLQPIEIRYFHYLLRTPTYTHEYNRLSYGIMYERNRMYFERFKLLQVLVPPLDEQYLIANWIDSNTSELNKAIGRIEREIDLIREYRTRLIADVVTGKLDVRAAAALPEELAEIEPEADEDGDLDDEPVEWEEETDAP